MKYHSLMMIMGIGGNVGRYTAQYEQMITYCLPVGTLLGLMSSFLNAAKNSSIGEAE